MHETVMCGRVILIRRLIAVAVVIFPLLTDAAFFETVLMPGKLSQGHQSIETDCDLCHERFRKKGQAEKCLACHDHADVANDIAQQRGFHGRLKKRGPVLCESCHTEHKGRDADITGLNPLSFDHSTTDFVLRGNHVGRECKACHEAEKKYREAPVECIGCHKSDDAHQGKLGEDCAECHGEKAWRVTDFDHGKTKFALNGKHRETACLLCHPAHHYKKTPTQCMDCHRHNDVHGAAYGKKCAECHGFDNWKQIEFDHGRKTKFALRGAHQQASCAACHSGDLYKDKLKRECISCHRNDDWHKGRNGTKCKACHNEQDWKESQFDHEKKTKFKLDGRHAKLQCTACHKGQPEKERDKRECSSCHALNDVHKGGAGDDCAECHVTEEWKKTRFRHDTDTAFRLRGTHTDLACFRCHALAPKEQRLATACFDCHRDDDVHKGQQGRRCQSCHKETSWVGEVRFEHDLSAFPLIGQHALVSCEACHASGAFKDASLVCAECHRDSDKHRGTLGNECNLCHNPNAWTAWIFDHDSKTDFKLEGAHAKLTCAHCHTAVVDVVKQSSTCGSCHRNDDVHQGAFGARCERCHGSDSFQQLIMKQ